MDEKWKRDQNQDRSNEIQRGAASVEVCEACVVVVDLETILSQTLFLSIDQVASVTSLLLRYIWNTLATAAVLDVLSS